MRGLLATSLYEISVETLYKKPSWQDLCNGPLGKISTNFYAMSLYKISIKDLGKISVQAPKTRSLGKTCCRDRCTSSSYELFWQDLWQDLCERPLGKNSVQDLFKGSLWQGLCASSLLKMGLPRSLHKIFLMIKWSPRHTESDLKRSIQQWLLTLTDIYIYTYT